jgi:microcystin degradation protein MlrC
MTRRILFAGLFHETHTFLAEETTRADFSIALGEAIHAKEGDGSPTAGFLLFAKEKRWNVLPTIDARAMPGGTVTEEVVDLFWREFSERATAFLAGGVDAIFLVLHGAMVSQGHLDVEGEVLERIRGLPGAENLPLFAVLDLHANISPRMVRFADCLVTYRANPHTDAAYTAQRTAELLDRCLATGHRPRTALRNVPIVWTPPGTGTSTDPMLTLTLMAAKAETENGIWAISVAAGFSFADTPDTGVAILACGVADETQLRAAAETLAAKAWDLRAYGEVRYPDVSDVLDDLLPVDDGPILLIEPSDNIGAGAPGDGTGILRALLAHDVQDALVILNDPAAVLRLASWPIGATIELPLGGNSSPLDAGPVTLPVSLVSRSDGRFELEDIHSHLASMFGRRIEMGDCAVVRFRGIMLLLTSRKTPPFDLGQLRSQGIEPTRMKIIGVKAAVAHQRAYNPIARASYLVETPGACSSQLTRFSFHHLRRPVYPLDADAQLHSR